MAKTKATRAGVPQSSQAPPEITEEASWHSAAALIEEARQWRIDETDHVLDGMDDVAEVLETLIAYVFDSMDYEADITSLPATLARFLAAIVADIQDQDRRAVMQ
jgi:hypothetical protein